MALLNTSEQQVYDLIASTNASTWPQTAVALEYGTPEALTGHPSGKNTSLDVTAAPNSLYTGTVEVFYNRLNLADFETNYGDGELIVGENPTAADVVAAFNTFYDASLEPADYVDTAPEPGAEYEGAEFPDYDGELYELVAAPGSLAYIGSVILKISLSTAELSTILTVTDLDGLTFPEQP